MAMQTVETLIDGVPFSIETGRIAKQAHGSAIVRMGDTMVIATVCSGEPREGIDFFPLSVEYINKAYAAGKIPGGFFKRESKPSEKEILSARLVDRPVRPLFPEGYNAEVQLVCTIISADEKHDADVLAITAASAALSVSNLPFMGPVAGVRVGLIDGKLKTFPTLAETEISQLDLIVAGSEDSIVMVEGGASEVSEELLIEAILLGHTEIKKLIAIQKELVSKCNVVKKPFTAVAKDEALYNAIKDIVKDRLHDISFCGDKDTRYSGIKNLLKEAKEKLAEQYPNKEMTISAYFHEIEGAEMRENILSKGERIGGRDLDTIRNITCELDILPRAHGSALFTRGETQAMVVATLGTKSDEQRIDALQGEYHKTYFLHYNFPPYSVGEVKKMGSTGRREIGHGHLAERSLMPVLPSEKSFPYTIRIVSEIMESNGSSSMASVCGGSLSLMATGVPIKGHVAGVAMGLIKDGDRVAILTDILGTEDHLGDMDFKVAGTKDGITAVQMDIKISGITTDLMRTALEKAKVARFKIIDSMNAAINTPRKEVSSFAPRVHTMRIDKDKIRDLIGPGGKMIREIQEVTGTTINVSDDGIVQIYATNNTAKDAATLRVKAVACDPEMGEIFDGKVKTVTDFGAFVEFMPGRDGLVHISELDFKRVERTEDIAKAGDTMRVKVIGFDRFGKIKLSRKALLTPPEATPAPEALPQ